MKYRENLPLVLPNLLHMTLFMGSGIALQLYMDSLGASSFEVSLAEAVLWSGMFFFAPLWGAMSDESGLKRPFLLAGIGLPSVAFVLFPLMGDVVSVLGLRFVFALSAAAFPPVVLAALSRRGRAVPRTGPWWRRER
ncbi:MAG: MFS transporter [Candidatus Nanohaloarchaea archaeon]